ncbi:uncharacterized protein LOC125314829 [Rhodamnia argentea]|uniref:Uncharacterized protein LOC125314829 n=1 Tax=Rhodamnia argentea TaxID=178133 RepID=A0ABM3HBQ7_9MYRT|nr:uncharacterized protein LOC125314829 [Rhodamnia argentea]
MSILDFLCGLWDDLEALVLKLMFIFGDDAVADGSWIHPEHTLQPAERHDPFYCMACKEIGFVRSYSCEPCAVHVHKECMSPPPIMCHPLPDFGDLSFVRSVTTYDTDADDEGSGGKFCGACSKPLRGCGYMSADGKSSFHPCCLHLDRSIKVNGEKLKLKMENISMKCNWCKTVSTRARRAVIPSWSYVSKSKGRRFHVGCVQEMMCKSWRDGGIDQPVRGKEEDNTANFATCLSLNIELPIDEKEEREADPSESAMQTASDLIMKDVANGNTPFAAALRDQIIAALGNGLGALTEGVGSGSSELWDLTKRLWKLLLLKIHRGITQLADTPVGRAGRHVWTAVTQPSKLWELLRPVLRWVSSKLCELASRMLTGQSSPVGRLPYDGQNYLMDSI